MIDERLLWILRKAGEEWGPMVVAMAAAHLAGEADVLARLQGTTSTVAPWEPMGETEQ